VPSGHTRSREGDNPQSNESDPSPIIRNTTGPQDAREDFQVAYMQIVMAWAAELTSVAAPDDDRQLVVVSVVARPHVN